MVVWAVEETMLGHVEGRSLALFLFFFQAEDGIRDLTVTGVQTCALPISPPPGPRHLARSRVSSHCLPQSLESALEFALYCVFSDPHGRRRFLYGEPDHVEIGRASCRERV